MTDPSQQGHGVVRVSRKFVANASGRFPTRAKMHNLEWENIDGFMVAVTVSIGDTVYRLDRESLGSVRQRGTCREYKLTFTEATS